MLSVSIPCLSSTCKATLDAAKTLMLYEFSPVVRQSQSHACCGEVSLQSPLYMQILAHYCKVHRLCSFSAVPLWRSNEWHVISYMLGKLHVGL